MTARVPSTSAPDSDSSHRHSDRAAFACAIFAVFALGALLGYRDVFSPDIGYHMETGRRVVEDGVFPFREEFTFTCEGRPIQYMPWLFDSAVWLLFKYGGTLALVLFTIVMTLGSAAVLFYRIERAAPGTGWVALVPIALFFLGNFWEIRPHLVSWLLLNATLLVLDRYKEGDRRWLWFLPAIQVLWVNSHSLFILGLVCIGVYAVDEFRKGPRGDKRFYAAAALASLACCVSPFGIKGALYPIVQFAMLQPSSVVQSQAFGTAEFMSPFNLAAYTASGRLVLYQPLLLVQIFAAFALIGAVAGWRRHRLVDWLLLLGFAYVFNQAIKNHGYFLIAASPAVAAGWQSLVRAIPEGVRKRNSLQWLLGAASVLGCGIVTAQLFTGYLYAQERSPHRFGHAFNGRYLPVGASEFIARHLPKDGRMLNHWDAGGYLHFATGRPVFVDGRTEILGEDFYREYMATKDLRQLPDLLAKWRIDSVLAPFNSTPQWFHYCRRSKDWRMVYADAAYCLFLRQDCAPDIPALPPPEPGIAYPVFDATETSRILKRAASLLPPSFLQSMTVRQHEPREELALTARHLLSGEPRAAVGVGLAALRESTFPAPEIMLNLGHAFFETGDRANAAFCYEYFLNGDSDDLAEKRLGIARTRLRDSPPRKNR